MCWHRCAACCRLSGAIGRRHLAVSLKPRSCPSQGMRPHSAGKKQKELACRLIAQSVDCSCWTTTVQVARAFATGGIERSTFGYLPRARSGRRPVIIAKVLLHRRQVAVQLLLAATRFNLLRRFASLSATEVLFPMPQDLVVGHLAGPLAAASWTAVRTLPRMLLSSLAHPAVPGYIGMSSNARYSLSYTYTHTPFLAHNAAVYLHRES